MGQYGSIHGALIYKINTLSRQIIHAVGIHVFFIQKNLSRRFLNIENCLKHDT